MTLYLFTEGSRGGEDEELLFYQTLPRQSQGMDAVDFRTFDAIRRHERDATRTLGQGLEVSAIGLGCMGMSMSSASPERPR